MSNNLGWPAGCWHPGSCGKHGECQYLNCRHAGNDIKANIRLLRKAIAEPKATLPALAIPLGKALTMRQIELLIWRLIDDLGGAVFTRPADDIPGRSVMLAFLLRDSSDFEIVACREDQPYQDQRARELANDDAKQHGRGYLEITASGLRRVDPSCVTLTGHEAPDAIPF